MSNCNSTKTVSNLNLIYCFASAVNRSLAIIHLICTRRRQGSGGILGPICRKLDEFSVDCEVNILIIYLFTEIGSNSIEWYNTLFAPLSILLFLTCC